MKKIIIFASGSGSNAENIITHFQKKGSAVVTHVFSNNLKSKALDRAHRLGVTALHFDRKALYETNDVIHVLQDANPDLIILAGFLWIIPKKMLVAFPDKIINIHPALLPKYGGKGMYGMRVHEAVIANKEKESGITIHKVNEKYDEGQIIFQQKVTLDQQIHPKSLAHTIQKLEHQYFPSVIENILEVHRAVAVD